LADFPKLKLFESGFLIGTLLREETKSDCFYLTPYKMTRKRRHQEEAATALLDGMEGFEVIEKHMRKSDGSSFTISTLSNQLSQTLLDHYLPIASPHPDFYRSSLSLRKISQSDANAMNFFSYALRQQYDIIRKPPDSWSKEAKNALKSIKLLPENVNSFKLTRDENVELKKERGETREKNSSVIVEVQDANALLREVKQILENASGETPWTKLCMCLLIASGRRTCEILGGLSCFSPSVNKLFCIFEGQAKKRFNPESSPDPFEIPLLVEFDTFLRAYNVLRSQVHVLRSQVEDDDHAQLVAHKRRTHDSFQSTLGKAIQKGGLQSLPQSKSNDTDNVSPHSLRKIYLSIVDELYRKQWRIAQTQMAKRVLGHEDTLESLPYLTVNVVFNADQWRMENGVPVQAVPIVNAPVIPYPIQYLPHLPQAPPTAPPPRSQVDSSLPFKKRRH
jgi:hypothetical protein